MRRLTLVLAAVAIGSMLGLALDVARLGGLDAWRAVRAAAQQAAAYEALGRTIDVDGRAVYLDCRGAGSPAVILENGFGAGADGWGAVLGGVAAFTRVCAWDRPGLGRSAARGVHSAGETTEDLRAALTAAGERGPFVFVAHSFGGVYARIAATYAPPGPPRNDPMTVVGLVMIDTYEPDIGLADDPALPEDVRAEILRNLVETNASLEAGENLDWAATMAQLEAAGPVTQPAIFLGVDPRLRYVGPDPVLIQTLVDAWYRAMHARYPNGTIEIVPGAGHLIHLERPALVIERIRAIVERVRLQVNAPS